MLLVAIHSDYPEAAIIIQEVSRFSEVRKIVDDMEDRDLWPEGYDAVVEVDDNTKILYLGDGKWEDL